MPTICVLHLGPIMKSRRGRWELRQQDAREGREGGFALIIVAYMGDVARSNVLPSQMLLVRHIRFAGPG